MLDMDTCATAQSFYTGPFTSPRHRKRWIWTLVALGVLSLAVIIGILSYGNPMEFGTPGFWNIAQSRAVSILVIAVVVAAHSLATVSFQTVTANRIVTPSILGFEALYIALQTAAVFFFGMAGITLLRGVPQFFIQLGLMVVFATALYGWLLTRRFASIHIMLLVGVVLGGGMSSMSTFMQRMLDPNEFDVLTARLFGNIGSAQVEYLPYAIPIIGLCAAWLWRHSKRLDLLSFGHDTCTNLGMNHRREVIKVLVVVAILMATTTSLVGPMTFLGFLIATMAYSMTDSYDHRVIFPVAFLLGFVLLGGAYFVLKNIFYAQGAVTIIVELIGGLVFLIVIMRKGRL